eukprot:GHVH01003330.1.p1 GENE.GHVH01003330.1~~GHVH01003330.1.p1  ORF type:complete len:504 (+),score=34.26 GHVH01003330.1:132-1643(+)
MGCISTKNSQTFPTVTSNNEVPEALSRQHYGHDSRPPLSVNISDDSANAYFCSIESSDHPELHQNFDGETVLSLIRGQNLIIETDLASSFPLEDNYKFVKKLGEGSYSSVLLYKLLISPLCRRPQIMALRHLEASSSDSKLKFDRRRLRTKKARRSTEIKPYRSQSFPKMPPNSMVAIKKVKLTDLELTDSFKSETWIHRSLDHPNVVRYLESFSCMKGNSLCGWGVQEFVDGGTLLDLINQRGPLPLSDVKDLSRQLLFVVNYLHRSGGLCHMDIKPENVLIEQYNDSNNIPRYIAKLADFGISRRIPTGTYGTTTQGTLAYAAPEIVGVKVVDEDSNVVYGGECKYNCKVDIWALGCVIYEMLTGKVLIAGSSSDDTVKQMSRFPGLFRSTIGNNFDKATREILRMMLDPRPKSRYSGKQLINSANTNEWFSYPKKDAATEIDIAEALRKMYNFNVTCELSLVALSYISCKLVKMGLITSEIAVFHAINKSSNVPSMRSLS